MRHQFKKTRKINVGAQRSEIVVRNMLTSLVISGQIVTTVSKARVVKAQADKFFGRLVSLFDKYENLADVRREAIRILKSTLYTEEAGKKVLSELLPKYKELNKSYGFISDYKLGVRSGDGAEKILLKLN
ncbi:MAG: L17 family ribosomal protein [Candidatus Absconditabacteria bacterium]